MRRRDFIAAAATLGAGGLAVAGFEDSQRYDATIDYPGRAIGHRLRDARELPPPSETWRTEVLIAGSGIAGLTARRQLARRGRTDVLLLAGPERHGNAAGGGDGELRYPTGAHYLPLPSRESTHVRELLADFGIITRDPYGERPTYDERFVVHAPAERVWYRRAWQDGYLPTEGVGAAERAQAERFFAEVASFAQARGSDGRRAFAVPVEHSSTDARFTVLDAQSFAAWLDGRGYDAPGLRWYLDYCCRDDYGRCATEISAWAGLHYFCARDGDAANAERGAVLTWPEGLSYLATHLEAAGAGAIVPASVARLRVGADGVEALAVMTDADGGNPRTARILARYGIAAMPLYVLAHVLVDPEKHGFTAGRDLPEYAPWLVANFILDAFPGERPGVPLAWDNVRYGSPSLGYVVSTHQDIRLDRPARTAFTAYHALAERGARAGREWLMRASARELTELAATDLGPAYGWRLPLCTRRVAVTVRGHAMAVPRPGFLSNAGVRALRTGNGPLWFAHTDLSGVSLFEEAAWWGYRAANAITGHPPT